MTTKVFLFDMDGVLINSEAAWVPHQKRFSTTLFGPVVYSKIGSTIGLSIDSIYNNAAAHGFDMPMERYYQIYDEQAKIIYSEAQPTNNLRDLLDYLKAQGYRIGLVSASRQKWINIVLTKLDIAAYFDITLSLNDHKELKPKPAPDGYHYAMRHFGALPEQTIILEDSNPGIAAAKASGAYTIGFTEHLISDYVQTGADVYADSVLDVMRLVDAYSAKSGK